MNPICKFGSVVILACSAFTAGPSSAQTVCPGSTVRFIVPFPASGASADTLSRVLASRLATMWSKNVIVDNKPGAGGILATQMVATSAPDGCTLGLVYAAIASNPSLFKKLPYDTLKDLAMVSQLVDLPIGLFALPSLPANNLAELVAYAKTRPEGLTYGSPGVGSASHLAGTMLASMTSANLIHIPYKGAAAAELDLVAGRISLMFAAAPTEVGFLKAGKLKLIAVAGDRRFPTYPEVPTIGESIPGFTMNSYFGVVASGRIPRPAVEQLSRDIASAMANPEVKARVEGLHLTVVGSTPEAFEKLVRTDIEAMAKVIKANGIEAQ